MNTTSFHIGTPAPSQLCSNAGLMLLATTADQVGVAAAIDTELGDRQNPNLVHTTGHTMTTLALALALGGDDANDVDLLDPLVATGLIDQVPSDSTVHRRHAELAGLGSDGTTAILAGMKSARRAAWAACGTRNPAARATTDNPLVIDLDATEILSHSDKEHATPTWKKHFGFHPLAAIIDHGDGLTGEPAAVLLRPGNAGSNTAADHITLIKDALRQLPSHVPGRRPGRRVLIRTDAAGCTHDVVAWMAAQRLSYSVGFTLPASTPELLAKIPQEVWQPAYDAHDQIRDGAWVAELTDLLDLTGWPPGMRVIARKERPHPGAQLRITDIDGHRVTAFATNTRPGGPDTQLADLELRHRRRARCEDRIRTAKDTGLRAFPLHDFTQNQLWLAIVALAAEIVAWMQMLALPGHQARRWEPKRLRLRIFTIPATIARHARRTVLHLADTAPWADLADQGLNRLRQLSAPG